MVELPYVGTPKVGDLLAFAYGNGFDFGVFCGYGSGTVQFYKLSERYPYVMKENESPWKSYMGGSNIGRRVIPYNPTMLPSSMAAEYKEIRKFLNLT